MGFEGELYHASCGHWVVTDRGRARGLGEDLLAAPAALDDPDRREPGYPYPFEESEFNLTVADHAAELLTTAESEVSRWQREARSQGDDPDHPPSIPRTSSFDAGIYADLGDGHRVPLRVTTEVHSFDGTITQRVTLYDSAQALMFRICGPEQPS